MANNRRELKLSKLDRDLLYNSVKRTEYTRMGYINRDKDETLAAQLCNTGQRSFKDFSISLMLT